VIENYALVTGASSGIGLEISKILAAGGYHLILVSNQAEILESKAKEINEKYSINCVTFFADLSRPESCDALFRFTQENNLNVEVLVNNAGILLFGELVQLSPEQTERIINLHMLTPVKLSRMYAEKMVQNRKGWILNISSISAVMPYPGISLYGPTKTFVRYFSRAIRHELLSYNVSVTCALPGATETGLYDPNKINLKLAKRLGVMHSAEFVAYKAVKAMFKRKAIVTPGLLNKITVVFLPMLPSFIISMIHRKTEITKLGQDKLA